MNKAHYKKIFLFFIFSVLSTNIVAAVDVFMSNDQTINNGDSATFTCDIDPDLFYYVTYEIRITGNGVNKVLDSGTINAIFAQKSVTVKPTDYNSAGTYTITCSATEYGYTDSDAAKLIVKEVVSYRHENCCDNYGWDGAKKCGGCCGPAENCIAYHKSDPYNWHDSNEVWQCDFNPNQNSIYHFVKNCNNYDSYDSYTNYCSGNIVRKHRLFHDWDCDERVPYTADCYETSTSWKNDEFVEDCDSYDGWYDTANTRWKSTSECVEKEQKEQIYRDYYCSEGACKFNTDSTQWIDTGKTRNKPDGTICDDGLWCNINEACKSGVCTGGNSRDCSDSKECTDNTCNENLDRCENPNLKAGTLCGSARDCPDDHCDDVYAKLYPDDGHDTCDGNGNCKVYSCAMETFYCTDNDPFDGINTLECGASCDSDNDCNDQNIYTIDTCNLNTCSCEHKPLPYCGNGVIDPGEECELPNTVLASCNYGANYLQDYCDSNCKLKDDDCEDDYPGCTSSPKCDEVKPGTNNCDLACQYKPQPYCGDNNIDLGEQCELPNTNNNEYCYQTKYGSCSGNKIGIRDNYGNCNNECGCTEDTFTYQCIKGKCGATCDSDDDCEDNACEATYYDYCDNKKLVEYDNNKIKDSTTVTDSCDNTCKEDCLCTNCNIDCSPPETNTYCVADICGAECSSDIDCDDSNKYTIDSCNINTCMCEHEYLPYCGDGNIDQGETCELPNTFNNPYCTQTTQKCFGNKLGTRDAYGDCNNECGCSEDSFFIRCVKCKCGAQCDSNDDCVATECDYLDGCIGNDYYDYNDVNNNCLDTCMCEQNKCTKYAVYVNDQRCTECQKDDDCSHLNKDYCDGNLIKHDEGKCINYECTTQTTTLQDCNNLDRNHCNDTKIFNEDYTCDDAICELSGIDTIECNDNQYCNGQETCENAACISGTPVDCSGNDICGIATCTNNPDNNLFTWDYRKDFTSICDEDLDICTTGSTTITHSCDISKCGAECEKDSDCNDGNEWTNNYCTDCICKTEYIPHCGDNNIDPGEECDLNNLNGKTCLDFYEIINNVVVYYVNGNLSCDLNCMFDKSCILPDCADGIDNDNDSLIDYPSDPGCGAYYDTSEYNPWPQPRQEQPSTELTIKRITILNENILRTGDDILLYVTLYNDGDVNLKNLKITATVPELGMIKNTRRFDLKKNNEVTKIILLENIPDNTNLGEYDLRITASNDILTRVIHRPIKIIK